MTCTTHHFACACREQMVQDLCKYLMSFSRSEQGLVHGPTRWADLDAAIEIARDLYGEKDHEDHPRA